LALFLAFSPPGSDFFSLSRFLKHAPFFVIRIFSHYPLARDTSHDTALFFLRQKLYFLPFFLYFFVQPLLMVAFLFSLPLVPHRHFFLPFDIGFHPCIRLISWLPIPILPFILCCRKSSRFSPPTHTYAFFDHIFSPIFLYANLPPPQRQSPFLKHMSGGRWWLFSPGVDRPPSYCGGICGFSPVAIRPFCLGSSISVSPPTFWVQGHPPFF